MSSTPPGGIPRVGGVRCYWALVSPRFPDPSAPSSKLELVFVHPDPVLAVHLARQKMSMIGRGLLEFIHPAEREQARSDLANAIAADDLQGSVTRLRFARLTQIRRLLGGREDELEVPFDASTFVEDEEYLIIDLVLNWVADGLLLAFFHAIRDKDPVANNDPSRRNEEWTNYCGTASIDQEQIASLYHVVSSMVAPSPPSRHPPTRVFQIHTTTPVPNLVFSWPPARPPGSPNHFDGLYEAQEYSDLMRGVDMDPSQLSSGPDEIRTNCTTRFGAKHSITTEGVYRHVTSVFIPYGNLIFSCFQTIRQVELQRESISADNYQQQGIYNVFGAHNTHYTTDQAWESVPGPSMHHSQSVQVSPPMQPPPLEYSTPQEHHVDRSAPYPVTPYTETYSPQFDPAYSQSPSNVSGPQDTPSSASKPPVRPLIKPPGSVTSCRICGSQESPEWRRSDSGLKDLCNACGLRLARQVAKQEGRQRPRKRKDRPPET